MFKKSVLRTASLAAAAFMLMSAMSGCNTAENKEETAMNDAAETSSVSSAETTAAETTTTAETTAETLPPVSYPCEFAKGFTANMTMLTYSARCILPTTAGRFTLR